MLQKIHLLFGFGLIICVVGLLSFIFIKTNPEKVNQPESYFNLSIEELMEIEVTTAVPQKEHHA